ncbi:MAG: hypothetical protein IJ608_11520 [Lachnospiraceae bacterium]|nr:hypothetical protein [Lachnospiraceae bacterium]
MKKLSMALVLSLAMAMFMGMTVFASSVSSPSAPSVTPTPAPTATATPSSSDDDSDDDDDSSSTTPNSGETSSVDTEDVSTSSNTVSALSSAAGEAVALDVKGSIPEAQDKQIKQQTAATLQAAGVSSSAANSATVMSTFEVDLIGADGTGFYSGVVDANHPLTFTVPTSATFDTANYDYILLHFTKGAWKREAATFSGNKVTATVTSLSPFAIVRVAKGTGAGSGSGLSPKTGEMVSVFAVVCIAALVGAVYATKKSRYNG